MSTSLPLQLLGLLMLFGGVALGYWRWIRPYQGELTRHQQSLLLLVALTLVGGFVGAFGWWFDVRASFSWDLPPLAARMLAAAGWAFAAGCWLALERPSLPRLRLIILMLFVYLVPLTGAIVLFHLGNFDWAAPITYAFFVIVLFMVGLTIWHLVHPVGIVAAVQNGPMAGWGRGWLWGTAILMALWGLALFFTDAGPWAWVWVWPGDLLTSRLIAVMLWTLATAAIYGARSREAAPVALAVLLVYGVGVVAANVWNPVAIKPLYTGLFALTAVGSAVALWQNKSRSV